MKKYEVIALSVGGLGNKVFSCGDIVQENNFVSGRADELVKLKFLKLVESIKPEAKSVEKQESNSEENKSEGNSENKIFSIDDITSRKIKEELAERNIPFKSNASKQELYDLWVK